MVIKMLIMLGEKMEENTGNFNKEIENTKKNQSKLTEIENTLEGINNRLEYAREWISDLENSIVEIIQSKQQKEKKNKKLWG